MIYFVPDFPVVNCRTDYLATVAEATYYQRLKKDIEENGIRNPLVGESCNGRMEIGLGKQRLKVAVELGLSTIPLVCKDPLGIVPNLVDYYKTLDSKHGIEFYFDENYYVDPNSFARGKLAIKKHKTWRQEQ